MMYITHVCMSCMLLCMCTCVCIHYMYTTIIYYLHDVYTCSTCTTCTTHTRVQLRCILHVCILHVFLFNTTVKYTACNLFGSYMCVCMCTTNSLLFQRKYGFSSPITLLPLTTRIVLESILIESYHAQTVATSSPPNMTFLPPGHTCCA